MPNITRWDPFGELERFDAFRDLDDFFKRFTLRPALHLPETAPDIKLDIAEEDKAYTVKAEIPGVKKDDIQVSVEGNRVSISAEVKQQKEEKEGKRIVRSERYYGRQYRGFTLAHDIDDGKVEARYQDGILELTLPKRTGGKETRKIEVH